MKNILMTTLFHSDDKKLSENKVSERVIDELNILSHDKQSIEIDEKPITVYFRCVSVLDDNLGLNQILSFAGEFNAEFYCRRCRLSSNACKTISFEVVEALRTVKNYNEDLSKLKNGVTSSCMLNNNENFRVVSNPSLDLMHDMFEGLSVYTIEGVLTHFILKQQKILLQEVNELIKNFNYGSLESGNKPRPLEIKVCSADVATGSKRKIMCQKSASEMV